MSDKTGIPYEKLAQVVFQSIVNQSDARNVVVRHNVTLKGKFSNSHQIDVFWKCAKGCLESKTVVQAKDWKARINQGELFKFKGVLDDLPGQPIGIVVARSGYQKGARDYAYKHGILLYELREADYEPPLILTTTGWAHCLIIRMPLRGIIATTEDTIPKNVYALAFAYDVVTPDFSNAHFDVSASWLQTEHPTTDASKLKELNVPASLLHEVNLYNEEGAVIGNLATIFQQVAQDVEKDGVEQKRVTHVFERPTFMQTDSSLIPKVKIDAVSVDVKIEHKHVIRRGRIMNFPQWVLREINSGSTDWFAATPSVTSLLPSKKNAV